MMKAMVLRAIGSIADHPTPLTLEHRPVPEPAPGEVLIQVRACGVCHTELDEIEGRTPPSVLPRVLGHQAVGRIVGAGDGVERSWLDTRAGVAWIYRACGACRFCQAGLENLCPDFEGTGRDADGGYAEFMVAPVDFVHRIPDAFADTEAAPLLCAGAIGYRSLRLTDLEDGQPLGLTGFGASAHLVLHLARRLVPGSSVFVFARDPREREFARELGAAWAGETTDRSPEPLAAIIDTTPAWTPVVEALGNLAPGGRLVINAIRKIAADKDALTRLDYPAHLWREKEIKSVANVTRADVRAFLDLAASIPIRPTVETYPLEAANDALVDLTQRRIRGAKVLEIG